MSVRLASTGCFLALLGLVLADSALGQESAGQRKTISLGKNPESVCRGFGGKLYATMINGDEPGDGTIVVIDGDKVSEFAKGMNAPKGLAFVNKLLIAADEKTLWKVDANGTASKLVEAKDFPSPIEFLNDVAASRDGQSVYVAEMSTPTPMFDTSGERKLLDLAKASELPKKGCVYRVTLDGKVSVAIPAGDDSLRFPNGVAVGGLKDQERLFAADFFTGNIVTYADGKYKVLATGPRGADGLTVTKDAFIVSSWTQGVVWRIDRKTKEHKVLLDGLKTAADFFYDNKNKQLLVPDMVAGTLTFLPIE